MKANFTLLSPTSLSKYIFLYLFIFYCPFSWASSESLCLESNIVFNNIAGTLWVETDGNGMDDGETGPSGVLVSLYDNENDSIIAQTTTVLGKYEFNGITPGKYYIHIDKSAFLFGGALLGMQSCLGVNDANDMIDNDDNGTDTAPNDVFCSPFNLTNSDPNSDISIEYIDFCFYLACNEISPFAQPSCEDVLSVDIFCDMSELNNICATMPVDSSTGNQPSPLCDGFSNAQNISWFGFIAADGAYNISISALDCAIENIGQKGIQVGLYKDCSFDNAIFCSDLCTEDPILINFSLLVPGQVYYLYINGCNGSVCNYNIDILGSPVVPSLEPIDVCVLTEGGFLCEDLSYCPNSDIIIQGSGVNFTGSYSWSISTKSGPAYDGDVAPITETNELVVNIPTEGAYEFCLTKTENLCVDQTWSGSICRIITIDASIPMPLDEDFGETFVCEDDIDNFNISIFANDDPNGDNDFGWNAPIPEYMLGINQGIVYTEGCSYDQQFTLSTFAPSPVENVLVSVCEVDLPIQVDYLNFSVFTFGGATTITFDSLLLQNSQNENGCDSIINLTVEKLTILQGSILDPICTSEGISLEFDYIDDLSTDIDFLEFVWKGPLGNILPFGNDPTTLLAPFESGNGEYTLDITINKNGVTCNYSYSTFVDIPSFLPPAPIIEGPSSICTGDNSSVYTAVGNGEETMFIWAYPNDISSASTSGLKNDTITIDWTGSNGGEIIAIGTNNCGQSNQTSFDVQVIPKTTPNFNLTSSECVDNPVTITFLGTGINLTDYSWDFDGATVLSGSGMGPYEVSWDLEGEKVVSLITTDLNGCQSNLVEKTIQVKAPLTPTAVTCIPSIGEVVFTWEIPVGVSGFEVNVLSGQTGGVFSATSFTLSGLDEGEEVTIELLTMPEDPICGSFVSTFVSCTALDCIPPEIELTAIQSLCADGDNITIDATISSGETGEGVFSGPGIVDASNGIFDPSLANIGINTILYSFTSDVAGCVGSKTISIEVFESPIASFTQTLDTMCITDVLDINYTGTPNTQTINWDFDGGLGSGLLTDQQVTFNSPGLKTISLQVINNGCLSNTATSTVLVEAEIDDVIIQCDSAGTDFLTFSWNEIDGVSLFEITVDNDPPFFSPNTSITIDGLSEEQEVNISVSSLSITSCPGSSSSSMCVTTKSPVAVKDNLLSQIEIFPNPITHFLYINGVIGGDLTYVIYNIVGNSIKTGVVSENPIDLSTLQDGLYILWVQNRNTGQYKEFKLVKK